MSTKGMSKPEKPTRPKSATAIRQPGASRASSKLIEQYSCGPVQFSGTGDAVYERHLLFDNVVEPPVADARMRYEAVAY